jgi:hypothetical protein
MEPFISADTQMIQNSAIAFSNDAPLSNFLDLFCQEFRCFSAVVRSKRIAAIQSSLNRGTGQIHKIQIGKARVVFSEPSAPICLQQVESFGK